MISNLKKIITFLPAVTLLSAMPSTYDQGLTKSDFEYIREAALNGSAEARFLYGICCQCGYKTKLDFALIVDSEFEIIARSTHDTAVP